MPRPVRLYQHVFINGSQELQFARAGETPCKAKNSAFAALEQELRTRSDLPRVGWRLLKQSDITFTLLGRPVS